MRSRTNRRSKTERPPHSSRVEMHIGARRSPRTGRERSPAASARRSGSSRPAAAGLRPGTPGTSLSRSRHSAGCARTGSPGPAGRLPRSSSPSNRRRLGLPGPGTCRQCRSGSADPGSRSEASDLRVVGRDDDDVLRAQQPLAMLVDVWRPEQAIDLVRYERCLFRRSGPVALVLDLHKAQAVTSLHGPAVTDLRRVQPAFVERLRDEGVDLWPHPPGPFQELPHALAHRLVLAEQVSQHRLARARRDARPGRPAGADSGRRARRAAEPPCRRRSRRPATPGRLRPRTTCSRRRRTPAARRGTTCRQSAAAPDRAGPRCRQSCR